jgi:hypothetical protein
MAALMAAGGSGPSASAQRMKCASSTSVVMLSTYVLTLILRVCPGQGLFGQLDLADKDEYRIEVYVEGVGQFLGQDAYLLGLCREQQRRVVFADLGAPEVVKQCEQGGVDAVSVAGYSGSRQLGRSPCSSGVVEAHCIVPMQRTPVDDWNGHCEPAGMAEARPQTEQTGGPAGL